MVYFLVVFSTLFHAPGENEWIPDKGSERNARLLVIQLKHGSTRRVVQPGGSRGTALSLGTRDGGSDTIHSDPKFLLMPNYLKSGSEERCIGAKR